SKRDWSSDVCSSDLGELLHTGRVEGKHRFGCPVVDTEVTLKHVEGEQRVFKVGIGRGERARVELDFGGVEKAAHAQLFGHSVSEIGRASCRERGGER